MEAGVGNLLKLDGRRRLRATGKKASVDAQILIFTGVRYERGTPSIPKKSLDPRPKRKRG
jgi:hypothetical protein